MEWFKADGTPLQNGQKYKMLQTQDGNHAMTIMMVEPKDAGTYVCVARNQIGQVQYGVNLNVLGKLFCYTNFETLGKYFILKRLSHSQFSFSDAASNRSIINPHYSDLICWNHVTKYIG